MGGSWVRESGRPSEVLVLAMTGMGCLEGLGIGWGGGFRHCVAFRRTREIYAVSNLSSTGRIP